MSPLEEFEIPLKIQDCLWSRRTLLFYFFPHLSPSNMDKRYQVFVSSTYYDLIEERQAVMQSLLELGCIPAGMELFPAADDDQWTVIQRVIDECDYYVVIIAGRYGSLGKDGRSYTHMEYEYAVEKGKPVIAFLHADPTSLPVNRTDRDLNAAKGLDAFREVVKKRLCKQWRTAEDLRASVMTSLVRLMNTKPAIGWVRADALGERVAEILRPIATRFANFFPKNMDEIIDVLRAATTDVYVMTDFIAYGYYANPEAFDRYKEQIKQARLKDANVKILVYAQDHLERELRIQFRKEDYENEKQKQRYKHFILRFPRLRDQMSSYESFIQFHLQKADEEARFFYDTGAEIHVLEEPLPIFFWAADEEEAVFSVQETGGVERGLSFRTTDRAVVGRFVDLFKQKWESTKCLI